MKTSTKTILHRTVDGLFIAAFDSSVSAATATGVHYSTVQRITTGVRGSKKFSFVKQNRTAIHNATRGKMRVTQRNADDIVVAVYADMQIASEMTGSSIAKIRSVLNNSMLLDGFSFNG